MQYQLKTGRVIYLSVEEYLSLSDQDIQDLEGSNLGDYPISVWAGSAIKKEYKPKEKSDIDKSIDFKEDSDEVEPSITIQSTALAIITIDETPSESEEEASEEAEDT